jgi:hypothetical protein
VREESGGRRKWRRRRRARSELSSSCRDPHAKQRQRLGVRENIKGREGNSRVAKEQRGELRKGKEKEKNKKCGGRKTKGSEKEVQCIYRMP